MRKISRLYLRVGRVAKGLTLTDVGQFMGWSVSKVWRIETGRQALRFKDAEKLSALVGIPVELIVVTSDE